MTEDAMTEKQAAQVEVEKTPRKSSGPARTSRTFSVRRRWLNVLNLGVVIFLSLYILVVGNIIVFRHPFRVDLTARKLHTLSAETRSRLELIEDDIIVIIPFVFREDAQIYRQIFNRSREILGQYVALQPKIRIEAELNLLSQKDSTRWVAIRDERHLTGNQINSFIFINASDPTLWQVVPLGDLASFDTSPPRIHKIHAERAFTEALTRLIRREQKKVFFTRDSGEASLEERGESGLSRFREELVANGYIVKELSLSTLESVPPECDLLVMVSPSRVIAASEQAKIHDYLLEGGRFLAVLGPATTGIGKVLGEWGVRVAPGQVYQKKHYPGGITRWVDQVVSRTANANHPATRGFSRTDFEFLGRSVRALEVGYRDNLTGQDLITTRQSKRGGPSELFVDANGNRRVDEGEEKESVVWGAAVFRRKPERPPPGYRHLPTRLAVFGDGTPWSNFWIDRFSHRDVALNTVRWLLGHENEIGGSGEDWVERRIRWSPEIAAFLFWVPIFVFPGIVLCFGTFVYFLRQR